MKTPPQAKLFVYLIMLTKSRFKFSKLYFPGLISLIFLPLICVIYLWNDGKFQKIGVMNVVIFNTDDLQQIPKTESFNIEKIRKYQIINFTGNPDSDVNKEIKISNLIQQLSRKRDFSNGICISFGKHAKYKDFINVLDAGYHSSDTDIITLPYNDKIFIWKHKAYVYINYLKTDDGGIYFKSKLSFYDMFMLKWKKFVADIKLLTPYWPSGIIFLLMIGLIIAKKRYYFFNNSVSTHN